MAPLRAQHYAACVTHELAISLIKEEPDDARRILEIHQKQDALHFELEELLKDLALPIA